MQAITRRLLEQLLKHAESEERSGKRRAFNLTESRAADYLFDRDLQRKDRVHSELIELERQGILTIQWERRAGVRGLIEALSATSPALLAPVIGVVRHKDALARAEALLAPYADHPRVQLAFAQWRNEKRIRGCGPGEALQLLQALRVVAYGAQLPRPTAVRRVSAALFGDSKRIEGYVNLLDFLQAEDDQSALQGTGRTSPEIFAASRMIRYAQPLLMAGYHRIRLATGESRTLAVPYEGIAPEALAGIDTVPTYVLTVENLTTFHELAALQQKDGGLILFTAGNFSPAFEASYRRLAEQSQCRRFLHWGDVDGKGIEITVRLAQLIAEVGSVEFEPWKMDAFPILAEHVSPAQLDDKTVARMVDLCEEQGWTAIADAVRQHRCRVEQESQPLALPSCSTAMLQLAK